MRARPIIIGLLIVIGAPVVLFGLLLVGVANGVIAHEVFAGPPVPYRRYLLPPDFKGCVYIETEVPDAGHFPLDGGFRVVDLRVSTHIQTADPCCEFDNFYDEHLVELDGGWASVEGPTTGWGTRSDGGYLTEVDCYQGFVPPEDPAEDDEEADSGSEPVDP